jgi:TyrR family helix-turn-helix protein
MNIALTSLNRPGITQDVLACISQHGLDLSALEVVKEHIYLDLPTLTQANLHQLGPALLNIEGVQTLKTIDLLPNERRRRHLDALLSTLPDPVFAVDAKGFILSANAAAALALKSDEKALIGEAITHFLNDDKGKAVKFTDALDQNIEVTLANQSYWLECKPIKMSDDHHSPQDQMLTLQTPQRLGHQLSKIQPRSSEGFAAIAGQSESLLRTKERAQRFANIHAPLLIQGETGTGKELFARAIHQASPWRKATFLALNCAALPENLIESELFGYAPGAFTGAERSGKPGLFELAEGGTAFLDEIGEMSPYVQAKLLRFIQDGSFRRVGGKEERKVSVRIICASHADLEHMVDEKQFREDLMYRLNVLNLNLPPLRERHEDIAPLAQLFVQRASRQMSRVQPQLSTQAIEVLESHPWPGNVRQLENLLFRTVALCQGDEIDEAALKNGGIEKSDTKSVQSGEPESWKSAQAEFEKSLLLSLYHRHPSSRKLAKRLGVSHTTIADKLRLYQIPSDAN